MTKFWTRVYRDCRIDMILKYKLFLQPANHYGLVGHDAMFTEMNVRSKEIEQML